MAWYLSGPLVDSLAPLKAWRGTYCIVPMEAISKPSEREKRLGDVDSSGGEKSISIVQGLSRTVTAVDKGRGVKTGKTEKTEKTGQVPLGRVGKQHASAGTGNTTAPLPRRHLGEEWTWKALVANHALHCIAAPTLPTVP